MKRDQIVRTWDGHGEVTFPADTPLEKVDHVMSILTGRKNIRGKRIRLAEASQVYGPITRQHADCE